MLVAAGESSIVSSDFLREVYTDKQYTSIAVIQLLLVWAIVLLSYITINNKWRGCKIY